MQVKFILTNRFWTKRWWSENVWSTELEVISLNEKIDCKNKKTTTKEKKQDVQNATFHLKTQFAILTDLKTILW